MLSKRSHMMSQFKNNKVADILAINLEQVQGNMDSICFITNRWLSMMSYTGLTLKRS